MKQHNRTIDGQVSGRIEYIDVYRFIGILLMIMGHIGFGEVFDKWIHAFHMPMFFVISGFFHKNRGGEIICRKAKSLLIPYFIFGVINILISYMLYGSIEKSGLYSLLIMPTDGNIPIAGALWFLPALFWADIIYDYIASISSKNTRTIVIICLAGISFYLYGNSNIRLPYSLDVALVGIVLFEAGHIVKEHSETLLNISFVETLIMMILFSYTSIISVGYVNMKSAIYPDIPLFFINSIGMSIAFLNFSKYIYNKFVSKRSMLKNYICSVGEYSLVYVCLNQLAILISRSVVENGRMALVGEYTKRMIVLIISLLLLKILELLFVRTKLSKLIGY
ncbi:acyltransferase family protein [Pseudobutyrivibrio ruminis]|uniref:Fucose 4-O-acetylase n=1 Tax=Pseudobutyrivibrio ruminis DSM 9787 TaxID=1123011 RepID=A0A285S8N9_9FIRM|nr:acyltransferase family protein [Pseudobutyrivibrio ruminis]SOC03952.1 Fucose 4-O-acetylase [Pseudobutyrivibrio ruminis DSM 9787]